MTNEILALLRRLDNTRRVRDLAATLGFSAEHARIPRDRWPGIGLATETTRGSLFSIGRLPAAIAWVLVGRHPIDVRTAAATVRALQSADLARQSLLFASDRSWRHIAIAALGPDGEARTLLVERARPRASDAETLFEMITTGDEGVASLALRYARALDRARASGRFFDDFRDRRAAIAAAWSGIPAHRRAEREQLAMLFLSRLMFLYFLQHAGHLAGNRRFLPALVRRQPVADRRSIYRSALVPLFFGALNRRPERRSAAALRLGPLPYLNGGLFERHALERRFPRLDLPDAATLETFDLLLERYRFTTREPADSLLDASADGGIDPEMLGRVFEGVMAADQRSTTGAFYTPAHAVDPLVRDALAAWLEPRIGSPAAHALLDSSADADPDSARAAAHALAHARVLDPACGSGAFLLGTLAHVAAIRTTACPTSAPSDVRRDIIGTTLHGVDVDPDAALLCALRLWLALADSDGPIRPLPNLDRRVRQGDALLDPIDLAIASDTAPASRIDPTVRTTVAALRPLTLEYLQAEPGHKERLRARVEHHERAIARAWIRSLRNRNRLRIRELAATASTRDLFGDLPAVARDAASALPAARNLDRELGRLRNRLRDDRATPFFSFHVHFADAAEAGFDLILSNPPWVRPHRWPRATRALVRERYDHSARGWTLGARLAGAPPAAAAQTDLALLFVQRALTLLAPRGVLAMLLPAKTLRSLYAGTMRARLLADTPVLSIRDHSLDHHAIFRADAFATAITARRDSPDTPTSPLVHVRITARNRDDLVFDMPRASLPLFPDEPAAPWLLAPEPARSALRRMQAAGPPLARHSGLRTRRGIFTGANHVFIADSATPRLGGLASIRTLGFHTASEAAAATFEAVIEMSALRPLVRGSDIRAWSWEAPRYVIFAHDDDGRPSTPPPRLRRYLDLHSDALRRRSGTSRGFPDSALFRVSRDTLSPKVAWQDLAPILEATPLPASSRSSLGHTGPVIPLNTTYFIPTPDTDTALLLAAFLNSTPIRTFARTIAERAKDARFRFFAWTIACLPLPEDWRRYAASILPLARQATADRGLDAAAQLRLDHAVAHAFHLSPRQFDHIREFHLWLGDSP